jgi:phosphoglucosamine mutase
MQNLFGTDGIRGRVGTGIFTEKGVIRFAQALGFWMHEAYGPSARCVIMHDTRESAVWMKQIFVRHFEQLHITYFDGGIVPTPAAFYGMHAVEAHCALIISASHNPWQDAGIKILDSQRGKLDMQQEERITHYFNHFPTTDVAGAPHKLSATLNLEALYIEALISHFGSSWAHGVRVVLDTAHGATSCVAPPIFEACGAQVITIHNQPNGKNINEQSGSVHPQLLIQAVRQHQAHIGFAFDGDGDRVIAVNRHGEVKNGDDFLCVLTQHVRYKQLRTIVGTVMTNVGLERHFLEREITLLRTAVGDYALAQALREHGLPLAGEPVGHLLLRDRPGVGDGIMTALTLLELLVETHAWDLVSFMRYPQVSINVPVATRYSLAEERCAALVAHAQEQVMPGRVIVRYSGTEPVLRVTAEAETYDRAHQVCTTLVQGLQTIF